MVPNDRCSFWNQVILPHDIRRCTVRESCGMHQMFSTGPPSE